MKSKQFMSLEGPDPSLPDIGIQLVCKCGARRTFKMSDLLRGVLSKKAESIAFQSECEECGNVIAAAIGWMDGQNSGWSYGTPSWLHGNVFIDDKGLQKEWDSEMDGSHGMG